MAFMPCPKKKKKVKAKWPCPVKLTLRTLFVHTEFTNKRVFEQLNIAIMAAEKYRSQNPM